MENGMNAWTRVQLARDKERPYAADYIEEICDEFMELHGDRLSGDDGALIGGIGRIDSYLSLIHISDYKWKLSAQDDDFDPLQYMDRKSARRMERFSQFAVAA